MKEKIKSSIKYFISTILILFLLWTLIFQSDNLVMRIVSSALLILGGIYILFLDNKKL